MKLGTHLNNLLELLFLRRRGYAIAPSYLLYDWQRVPIRGARHNNSPLPPGAEAYLQPHHPRLEELQRRYALFDSAVTTPLVWTNDIVKHEEIRYFRGDNAYVYQVRGSNMSVLAYALTTYYTKAIDHLGLLEKLTEDDQFGIFVHSFDHKTVSRDLLDSIVEIYFLERHLSLASLESPSILDIGAGYGRLAHRATIALPNIRSYFCTDAFATSTFISEYYLRYRGVENKAKVIPLDEIERTLESERIDIAVNVHSFSECRMTAIEWWLSLLERHRVEYLMIVPTYVKGDAQRLLTKDYEDFQTIVERHGYELIARDPKYTDPVVQQYAVNPAYHHLFALK